MSATADGYVTQSPDTSRDIERRLIEHWRGLAPSRKFELLSDLQNGADQLSLAGIRLRHPQAPDHEVRVRLAALKYGREFAIAYLGWDPDQHGW